MLDKSFLDELSKRLSSLLPMAEEVREELRTKIEQQLKKSFATLNLLGREEFDAQRNALKRAEQRIQELEATLAELGTRLDAFEKISSDN
ncbi:MAG: accessory factor UbiK family protein [Pseudohongiella sp.]|mgnify:FL=1|jgi:BMFP domain-containing protein YqiC|nr:accessory factor UbiK family protein [Pseudohongiella sp.]